MVLVVKNPSPNAEVRDSQIWPLGWEDQIPWNRKWQPILVSLAGKFHKQRRMVGYGPWCQRLTEHTHSSSVSSFLADEQKSNSLNLSNITHKTRITISLYLRNLTQDSSTMCKKVPDKSWNTLLSRIDSCSNITVLPVDQMFSQSAHSVMSDSLRPHKLQYARLPCPSPTPGVHPNPCPLSRWCHPTISSSVVPFSSCPQPFPASGSFPKSQLFTCDGQSFGVSASTGVNNFKYL